MNVMETSMMEIQVQRMYRFETDRPLKAFADIVVNDALLIKGIRVMDGKKGLFVSMPRDQAKDKKWYDNYFQNTVIFPGKSTTIPNPCGQICWHLRL